MTHARILGAIIAGGEGRRFGSDKGAALLDGKRLLDHVAEALRAQCDALIVVGRAWPGLETVADRPAPQLGPLGGLNAALHCAAARGFAHVLTAGCDTLPIPSELHALAARAPAVVAGHYLIGCWPVRLAPLLDQYLVTTSDRSLRAWMARCGAIEVVLAQRLHNLNTPADLAAYALSSSLAAQP